MVNGVIRRARRERLSVLAALLLLGAFPFRVEGQVAVDQSELFLATGPQAGGVFNVVNDGDAALQARIYLNDWDRTESGENRFYPVGTVHGSCGARVSVFPAVLRVAPHTSQPVRVSVQGADSLACWTIAFVETSQPGGSQGTVRVGYNIRLGVKIYLLPPGLTREAELEALAPATLRLRDSSEARAISYTITNVGTAPIVVRGKIEFRRPDNSVAASTPIVEVPMLPSSRRVASTVLPTLPPGHYIALALFSYDGDEDIAGQTELDVP